MTQCALIRNRKCSLIRGMQQSVESDPVVAEVDVLLSQSLSHSLYLLQYPLRPAHLPYDASWVRSASVCPESHQLRLEVAILPHGENYSRSRGEGYARDADLAKLTPTTPSEYEIGLMDKHTLTAPPQTQTSHRYVAGVLKDGELHISPLCTVVQLRPNLQHLDKAAAGRKKGATGEDSNDMDNIESEGEEARPVTVKFARRETGTSRPQRVSYSAFQSQSQLVDEWVPLHYHPLNSPQADKERSLLFSNEDSSRPNMCLSPHAYLDLLCPLQTEEEVKAPSEPPGVVSLSHLKSLPIPQQVRELLCSTQVQQLGRLCTLVRCGRGQVSAYLEALQECGVLVQGCWVLCSPLAHPSTEEADIRTVRDYILYCFTQNRTIARRDIVFITKVPHEAVRQILAPLTSNGWEFKLATDHDFIHKYPHIVVEQAEMWRKRYEELKVELALPREMPKFKHSPAAGEEARRAAGKKSKGAAILKIKSEPVEETSQPPQHTPTHPASHTPHTPHTTTVGGVAESGSQGLPCSPEQHRAAASLIKQEPKDVMGTMVSFCHKVVGRGVVPLSHIKARLRDYQATLERPHPLSTAALTDSLVEEALKKMEAVEVGQPSGQRLFACQRRDTAQDKIRCVVLRLFQSYKWLKKKQLVEEVVRECGQQPDSKQLSSVLKEVAYSKGAQWYLLGT